MINQELYAFWKYDLFPYVLCGEVESINSDGTVLVKKYACSFKPILIVPKDVGLAMHTHIGSITDEYRAASKDLQNTYKDKVNKVFPV